MTILSLIQNEEIIALVGNIALVGKKCPADESLIYDLSNLKKEFKGANLIKKHRYKEKMLSILA